MAFLWSEKSYNRPAPNPNPKQKGQPSREGSLRGSVVYSGQEEETEKLSRIRKGRK